MQSAGRFLAFAALAVLTGCVTAANVAQKGADGRYIARAGVTSVMETTYLTLDDKCRPTPLPTAAIISSPRHGTVRIFSRTSAAIYGPGPFHHCNGTAAPSLAFEYTPAPGYRGPDGFVLRVTYADGERRTDRFSLVIR